MKTRNEMCNVHLKCDTIVYIDMYVMVKFYIFFYF